jgi:hypothetical protein
MLKIKQTPAKTRNQRLKEQQQRAAAGIKAGFTGRKLRRFIIFG